MKFILPVLVLCYAKCVMSLLCYWNMGCPYKYFSSKTPYNVMRGDIRDAVIKLTDCEPVSIWGLLRHGKRNPGILFAKPMQDAMVIRNYVVSSYETGNNSLCAKDVENLQNWVADKQMFDNPSQLNNEGYEEMVGLGRRWKQAFPKLWGKLDKEDYTFRTSHEEWVKQSIQGFFKGLDMQLTAELPKNKSDIMNLYTMCGKYQKDFKQNPELYQEANKYMTTSEYLASIDRIQRRLGIQYPLMNDNLTAMYDLCRYTSSENKCSPWCALFNAEDLKVQEYIADLRHYYRNAYGAPMSQLFGQIILADLLKSFQAVKKGNGKKITAYFSHATMMEMTYTALNLFKDDSLLTGANRNPNRKWKSSKNSIFSSNLVAVLNKCKKDDYNVVFYLNEGHLISICKEGVCTWQEFEDKFKSFLDTTSDFCEFEIQPNEM